MNGPFEIEIKVHMTDGERVAIATYSMPVGKCPTPDDINKAVAASLAKTKKEVGEEWRLMSRHEFENTIISERYGGMTPEFATEETWDDAAP